EDVAASRSAVAALSGDGSPEQLLGRRSTANLFSVLGMAPLLGRTFTAEEDRPDAGVVVISYGLWQRRFAADPAIVNREIVLSGRRMTVLGVMPPGFRYPAANIDFWTPIGWTASEQARRGWHFLNVVARMKPGVSVAKAQTVMDTVMARLARDYPDSNAKV